MQINPSFLPKVPGTGFTLVPSPNTAVVPYSPFGVPATVPPAAYSPNFTLQGSSYIPKSNLPAVISPAEGLGGMSAEAAPAVEAVLSNPATPEVVKRGILSRLFGAGAVAARAAAPIGAALAPMYFDKGSADLEQNTTAGSWASGLADEPDDLGITSLGKMWGRGAFNAAKGLIDPVVEAYDYLTTPLAERQQVKSKADEKKTGEEVVLTGGAGNVNTPFDIPEKQQQQEYVIPGASTSESTSSLDQMLAVLGGMKPEKGEIPPELQGDVKNLAILKSLDWGLPTNGTQLVRTMAAMKQADIQKQLQGLASDKEFAKANADWIKQFADTSVDVEKVKNEAKKGDFKIHSTRGGFLLEANEGGNKVLRPIKMDGASSSGKFKVGGNTFDSDNPLAPELSVLQNLDSIGMLDGVLSRYKKNFAEDPDIMNVDDPKLQRRAMMAKLAVAMRNEPQIAKQLMGEFVKVAGVKPKAYPKEELFTSPPPEPGNNDWEILTGGGH